MVPLATKHADIIRGIQMIVSKLRTHSILVKFFHLDGHQDDVLLFEELDRPSQLNVLMDHAAKARIDQMASIPFSRPPNGIQFEGWMCTVDGIKATSDPLGLVLHSLYSAPMIKYLTDPHRN